MWSRLLGLLRFLRLFWPAEALPEHLLALVDLA
jgi:hypothetical protein